MIGYLVTKIFYIYLHDSRLIVRKQINWRVEVVQGIDTDEFGGLNPHQESPSTSVPRPGFSALHISIDRLFHTAVIRAETLPRAPLLPFPHGGHRASQLYSRIVTFNGYVIGVGREGTGREINGLFELSLWSLITHHMEECCQ